MEFESPYADVTYVEKDNMVLLTWKKEARLEDYREPTRFALDQLKIHQDSNFIIDARHGFEDDVRDVEWGFQVLLPGMAETTCRQVGIIMCEVNDIDEEMDMWTKEFKKYFSVTRADSYEKAVATMKQKR